MNEVALFMTHTWSENIVTRYLEMRGSIQDNFDIFLLLDVANEDVHANWKTSLKSAGCIDSIFPHSATQLEKNLGYKCFSEGALVPGSAHFPVINFWKNHQYNNYWVIEFDVLLKMDWLLFFKFFKQSDADLICSHLVSQKDQPKWHWWSTLQHPKLITNNLMKDKSGYLKGFFPIYRLSENAVSIFNKAHQDGWQGHFEVLLPVIAQENQLIIEDINQRSIFYSKGPLGPWDGKRPYSSMRFRPEISPLELRKKNGVLLFHPVKESSALTHLFNIIEDLLRSIKNYMYNIYKLFI